MTGKTAIFYDIENLVGGYNPSKNNIDNVSLKSIFQQVQSLEIIDRVIIQKAYANWSDSRFLKMRKEINELGIDPIQVFGFSFYHKRNAADIQLAVDCIDIAYLRQNIDVFVIVSGDGGFSAVVKKLHEYGKYVVGCSYKSSTNEVFESVCDYFIPINEPQNIEPEKIEEKPEISKPEIQEKLKITNPLIVRMSKTLNRIKTNSREEIISQSKKVVNWLINDSDSAKSLKKEGLHLSVVREGFKYAIEDFDQSKIGLAKFVQFLQYICKDTSVKVISSPDNQAKIIYSKVQLEGFESLPDIDDNYLHSLENYQLILATGNPRIRIIEKEKFNQIVSVILSLKDKTHSLDSLSEDIINSYPTISTENINHCTVSLIHTGILNSDNEEKPISQQSFSLNPIYSDLEKICHHLKESIKEKLVIFLGDNLNQETLKTITDEIKVSEDSLRTMIDEIRNLVDNEQYENAQSLLVKALKLAPKNIEILREYAQVLTKLGYINKALQILDYALKIFKDDPDLLRIYGNNLLRTKQYDQAIVYLKKALQLEPNNVKNITSYGNILSKLDRVEDSLPYLKKATELEDNNVLTLNNYASALMRVGEMDECFIYLEKSLKIDPNNPITLRLYGNALAKVDKIQESLPYLQKSAEIEKESDIALSCYAIALLRANMVEESLVYWEKCLEINPDNVKTINSYATALYKLGRVKESIPYWEKSLRLQPHNTITRNNYQKALQELAEDDSK